ncbi:MAG: phosphate acyltransferase PlsX, partial [Clostridia bacterium]|nr:phosphate acyltransferase PlsX [Clostridia bacterium]
SAIVAGMRLQKQGQAQAFVSCGSTGAVLSAATLILGRGPGIARPGLVPTLPTMLGTPMVLIDVGANVDCKPLYLEQFAVMGSAYMQVMEGNKTPRVGLLNIGAEAEKGNELTAEVFPKLRDLPITFVGNVEARDMLSGFVDVVVCDAFAGNVALKSAEGALLTMFQMMKQELTAKTRYKLGAAMIKPALKRLMKRLDYTQYGGAPLLGVQGCVYKAHGSAGPDVVTRMIGQARRFVEAGAAEAIAGAIAESGVVWARE